MARPTKTPAWEKDGKAFSDTMAAGLALVAAMACMAPTLIPAIDWLLFG
jgi:hypothetical protein